MNNEIETFQAKITETCDEIKSFQGNVVIKSQTIAEQELQLKWFSEKQKILTEQKQNLEKHKIDLQNTLVNKRILAFTKEKLLSLRFRFLFQKRIQDEIDKER